MCVYCVQVCLYVCMYVRVWLRICVLWCLWGLSQNIEFHGHAIPGAVDVASRAIPYDNADAKLLITVISRICISFAYRDIIYWLVSEALLVTSYAVGLLVRTIVRRGRCSSSLRNGLRSRRFAEEGQILPSVEWSNQWPTASPCSHRKPIITRRIGQDGRGRKSRLSPRLPPECTASVVTPS